MRIVDLLIAYFVTMLESHGPFRNMRIWSILLSFLAILHFIMALLNLILLPLFPLGQYPERIFTACVFLGIGIIWSRIGKECYKRSPKK